MADGIAGGLQQLTGMAAPGFQIRTGYTYPSSLAENFKQAQSTTQRLDQAHSDSFIPEYSQTPILQRIAQEAEGMAPQVYQWGMDQFNRNQGNIDDLMRQGRQWASPQHIATMMGQAEAGVQQAGEQARASALRDLQSYGIDPSAGRYAALDQANRVQTAAAAAGAGNQQRMADIERGLTMQNQAISASNQNTQVGYGAANAMNQLYGTGMQLKYPPLGTTSASTGQTYGQSTDVGGGFNVGFSGGGGGTALTGTQHQPGDIQTGVGTPYNPAYSHSQFTGNLMARRGGYIGRDHIEHPDGYQAGGVVDPTTGQSDLVAGAVDPVQEAIERQAGMPQSEIDKKRLQREKDQSSTTASGVTPAGGAYQAGGVVDALAQQGAEIATGASGDPLAADLAAQSQQIGQSSASLDAKLAAQDAQIGLGLRGPVIGERRRRGYAGGGVVGTTASGFNPSGPVSGAPIGSPTLTSGVAGGMARGGPVGESEARSEQMRQARIMAAARPDYYGTLLPQAVRFGEGPGAGGIDEMTGQPNIGFQSIFPSVREETIPNSPAGYGFAYAHGGPVDPTTGGFVSQALSPSNGKQVDDVPARLNEGEYVIPRDVVQFKGKEFFHKLIAQSRKNREAHQQSFFGGGGVQSYAD
jgi:hypothetical protein